MACLRSPIVEDGPRLMHMVRFRRVLTKTCINGESTHCVKSSEDQQEKQVQTGDNAWKFANFNGAVKLFGVGRDMEDIVDDFMSPKSL